MPALVRLKVLEEDLGEPGRDYFHPGPGEQLFNTPGAISRVYSSCLRSLKDGHTNCRASADRRRIFYCSALASNAFDAVVPAKPVCDGEQALSDGDRL